MSRPVKRPVKRRVARLAGLAVFAAVLAACSGPILANPTLPPITIPSSAPAASRAPDPQPIVFPRDDAAHDRLTEWWYYTGHLATAEGRRFGFEAVIFRAERGGLPVTWASHLALTDETADRFLYAQRAEIGPQVDIGAGDGFQLGIRGARFDQPTSFTRDSWSFAGTNGKDSISAGLTPDEAAAAGGSFQLALQLSAEKPPALHGGIGWIDFGVAGSSYYYSRTQMSATGSVTIDGTEASVTGTAWFDHQWGDFISVGGGGWDWFALNLDDDTDLTVSLVRAADGTYPLVYGTLVAPDGTTENLDRDAFTVIPSGSWTSPRTGAVYPAGWNLEIPGEGLVIGLVPTVADQELDTRPTTGVVYWEGSQVVTATRNGSPLGGEAYVELTGYAPAAP